MVQVYVLDLKRPKNIDSKKTFICKKKRTALCENFTIVNKKTFKRHLKTCIFIDISTNRFKENSWSQK